MMFFSKYRKRKVIAAYLKKLAPLLIERYGKSDYFTLGQVKTTLKILKPNTKYDYYAYALFLKKSDFEGIYKYNTETMSYEKLCLEIESLLTKKDLEEERRFDGYPSEYDFSWMRYMDSNYSDSTYGSNFNSPGDTNESQD